MSNLGSVGRQSNPRLPTPPRGDVIARFGTYLEAQQAVDYLSDQHFPVQLVTIVGSGLRMVERVTGRLSYPRVALAGAASGAWFGLFVGVLLSMFSGGAEFGLFAAVVIGAGFGMLFGVISFAFTGGRRDFTSTSQIVASEYEVLCMPEHAGKARELLQHSSGGLGRMERRQAADGMSAPGQDPVPTGVDEPADAQDPSRLPPPSGPAVSHTPPWGMPSSPAAEPEPEPESEPKPDPDAGLTYGEAMERRRQAERERQEGESSENG